VRAVIRTAVVVALGALLVVGAVHLPGLHSRLPGAGTGVTAAAAETAPARVVTRTALVCPGPESVGVPRIDAASALSPTYARVAAPPSDLLSAVLGPTPGASTLAGVPGQVTASSLATPAASRSAALTFSPLSASGAGGTQTSVPRSILFSSNGSLAPGLAATQTTLIETTDLRGLSVAACQAPSAETWLVGGSATTGHRGRLILANPTPNPVTVNLAVFGAKGPITSTAARGIVVKAHRRTVVLLDAVAHGEAAPVIHVTASGGVVAATLSDTWLDGTTPAGSDDVVGTEPGRRLIVPGVLASLPDGSGRLRVAAVDGPAVVHLRVLGATGPVASSVANGTFQVAAGQVKDIQLTALPVGYSGVELTSSSPVVAGLQMTTAARAAGGSRDLAWTAAEPPVSTLAGVALGSLAPPWASVLSLTATGDDAALDLVLVGADGSVSTRPVTVTGGTTAEVPVPATVASTVSVGATTAPVSAWLRPRTGSVVAALATAFSDPAGILLSVAPLTDAPLRYQPVAVHPLAG
jgi:hypothetical protein